TTLVDVVLRLAPVRNDPGVVCTPVTALAKAGVTAVTTVVPGCPLTPFTTLVKAELTPVTHVSAEAADHSTAFRMTTLTESRRTRPIMTNSRHHPCCSASSITSLNDCNTAIVWDPGDFHPIVSFWPHFFGW